MSDPNKYLLRCPTCSATYPPREDAFTCERCDAPTVVAMNLDRISTLATTDETSMWRYFDLLPLDDRKWIVSQGEGSTPLIEAPRLAKTLGIEALLLKNETTNPTGSFKDRQISLSISKGTVNRVERHIAEERLIFVIPNEFNRSIREDVSRVATRRQWSSIHQ